MSMIRLTMTSKCKTFWSMGGDTVIEVPIAVYVAYNMAAAVCVAIGAVTLLDHIFRKRR